MLLLLLTNCDCSTAATAYQLLLVLVALVGTRYLPSANWSFALLLLLQVLLLILLEVACQRSSYRAASWRTPAEGMPRGRWTCSTRS